METQDLAALNEATRVYLLHNPWIIFLVIWIIIWKALALWQAAKKEQKVWFVALLIVNTAGLLEIIYLLFNRWQRRKERPINPIAPDKFSPPQNPNLP